MRKPATDRGVQIFAFGYGAQKGGMYVWRDVTVLIDGAIAELHPEPSSVGVIEGL
jgi:hypothetical protein